jgi:hypothetical protein
LIIDVRLLFGGAGWLFGCGCGCVGGVWKGAGICFGGRLGIQGWVGDGP